MSKKILIVDDEEDLVYLIKTRLESHGFGVVTAYDGVEAIEKAHSESPDLILLDIMMPAGDGFSVCQKLKSESDTKQIPIVFLSAKTLDKDERKGYGLGAEYYIKKPFDSADLIEIINKVLGKPGEFKKEVKKSKIWQLLLITDNIDVVQILEPEIKRENFKIEIAKTKDEAFAKIEESNPQLLVVDLYSKGFNSAELLKEIGEAEKLKNIPILLLASPGDKLELEKYAKMAYVLDVIENPYNISELILALKNFFS